jgi:acyl-CoA synthetase (AMP-forming)/AMP-acid ligase II
MSPFRVDPRTIADQFARARSLFADERCLLTPGGWWTFDQVGAAADGARALLADAGCAFGDRVVLALPNTAVLRILEQGILTGGLVRVAVSPRLHPLEIAAIAADAEAQAVCCEPGAADEVAAALIDLGAAATVIRCADENAPITPEALSSRAGDAQALPLTSPDDLAMLLYSSGTTGRPKGATVTHASWLSQYRRAMAQLPEIGPGDVVLAVAPMTHFAGSIGIDCMVTGAATVPIAASDPIRTLSAVREHRATVLPLAPVMLTGLVEAAAACEAPADVSTLRTIPYGGSPIAPAALEAAARLFPGRLVQFYGLAEALAPLAVLTSADHDEALRLLDGDEQDRRTARDLLSSAGRWVPRVSSRLASDELHVSGDVVTAGYWRRPVLNERAFRDGWFATGDLVRFDGDRLHVLGRADDLVISGGYNIHPGEVERALAGMPGILDIAVVGLPHPRWGRGVVAAVVLEDGHRELYAGDAGRANLLRALAKRSRASLASYKKPLDVHVLTEIPRNAAGKIDRNKLRERLADAPERENDASA